MKNSKGFAPIIFLILIAIIVAGGYLLVKKNVIQIGNNNSAAISSPIPNKSLVPSESPTQISNIPVDWKTYNNGWYGFSFEYPKTGKVDQTFIDSIEQHHLIVPNNNAGFPISMLATNAGPVCNIFTDLVHSKDNYEPSNNIQKINDISWTYFSGRSADSPEGAYLQEWRAIKDNLLFLVDGNGETCHQIVSSFKFNLRNPDEYSLEASQIKNTADKYASQKYPDQKFLAGSFIEDSYMPNGAINRVLYSTNTAIVAYGNPTEIYNTSPEEHSKSIYKVFILQKSAGAWNVQEGVSSDSVVW
jgi:hypothetical protein